ncbi:MAG: LEA type 2 family protein [Promethearchaeota archaeon]
MKKLLFLLGLGGIGYGVYYYFTEQLKLALDWDFKVSDFKLNSITSQGADIDLIISVLNKSSFAVEVKDYDIDVFYSGVAIAKAQNDNRFTVQADSWFDVPTSAYISFDSAKGILGDLGMTLLASKPIKITIKGKMNILIANIPKEIIFNAKDIMVSQNSAEDLGLSKPINKINDLLGKLGIKI